MPFLMRARCSGLVSTNFFVSNCIHSVQTVSVLKLNKVPVLFRTDSTSSQNLIVQDTREFVCSLERLTASTVFPSLSVQANLKHSNYLQMPTFEKPNPFLSLPHLFVCVCVFCVLERSGRRVIDGPATRHGGLYAVLGPGRAIQIRSWRTVHPVHAHAPGTCRDEGTVQ